MSHTPKVAVLGGGTGTFMMLLALKQLPVEITAILTMVDDGGSNRVLRDQFGLLPSSGITQCIVALSENQSLLRELMSYRFHQGEGLSGMRFGNLFIAAITDIVGSQKQAIEEAKKLLQVKGNILPISYDDVRLVAKYEDGSEIRGEHSIDEPDDAHDGTMKIVDLRTEPEATLSEDARQAILEADFVIFGPGDFYTNTVANFVVKGVPEALHESTAKKMFFTNLMTKYGETYGYSVKPFWTRSTATMRWKIWTMSL
ncbi:YvcK family protein [Candidatus Woesebacteria bacterium]|nr:YvcK family protein [Candidatus Woesebacteria bacterium]